MKRTREYVRADALRSFLEIDFALIHYAIFEHIDKGNMLTKANIFFPLYLIHSRRQIPILHFHERI